MRLYQWDDGLKTVHCAVLVCGVVMMSMGPHLALKIIVAVALQVIVVEGQQLIPGLRGDVGKVGLDSDSIKLLRVPGAGGVVRIERQLSVSPYMTQLKLS